MKDDGCGEFVETPRCPECGSFMQTGWDGVGHATAFCSNDDCWVRHKGMEWLINSGYFDETA